jgi:hypothetical protein
MYIIPPRHLSLLKIRAIPVFNWLKCLGGIMHLKPTAGCQISTLIFENKLWKGVSINIPWKIYQGRQSSCLFLATLKVLSGSLNAKGGQELCRPWYIFYEIFIDTPLHNLFSNIRIDIWHPAVGLRCIIPPRHLCQLKTRTIPEGGVYKYPIKNISRTAKFLPIFGYFKGIVRVFNWLKCLGGIMHLKSTAGCQICVRCIIPPSHLNQLNTRTIPLT